MLRNLYIVKSWPQYQNWGLWRGSKFDIIFSLKKYIDTIFEINMQSASITVDSKFFKLWPPDQGRRRGLKINLEIYRKYVKNYLKNYNATMR